jgi:penicillin-binding protein 1A
MVFKALLQGSMEIALVRKSSKKEAGDSSAHVGKWRRRAIRAAYVFIVLGLITLLGGVVAYKKYVINEPGEHLSSGFIDSVIAQESPVFYRDGTTKLGVFFSREHRDYVPYDRLPVAWVQAIVASEDQRYWDHPGVDFRGFARAMWSNVRAGGVVAGGSTLTQQTAKNLYYRPDRSVASKLVELVNALRLEAHYSKEQILEFYANQFHVSANGRGIGIAARYFFDKQVSQLTVQECAFIAGMVKAPAHYNPFAGSTPERRAIARERAQGRTNYVLGRMVAEGHISAEEFAAVRDEPLVFSRGSFRYASSIMLDEVQSRLERAPFPEVFEQAGIDNPSTAGIQVITTLDVSAQRATTYGLWHHLSEVGSAMEGSSVSDFILDESMAPRNDLNNPPIARQIRSGVVTSTSDEGQILDLGGFDCLLDQQGLQRAADIIAWGREGNRHASGDSETVSSIARSLGEGVVVRVSVRPTELGEDDSFRCDLEWTPELQGAALVAEEGQIRAMVGGNNNRDFNRAIDARRQLGSTWKSVVYRAALELGWSPVDMLDNRRGVFPFEGTWYSPSPDHEPDDFVSMSWAGVRSENLASIWLLYHLVDRLSSAELVDLAEAVGIAPSGVESHRDYALRVRDDLGVVSTESRLAWILFEKAKSLVIAEIESSSLSVEFVEREVLEIRSLHHGRGFSGAGQSMRGTLLGLEARATECNSDIDEFVEWVRASKRKSLLSGLWMGGQQEPSSESPPEFEELSIRLVNSAAAELACGEVPDGFSPVDDWIASGGELDEIPVQSDFRVDNRVMSSTLLSLRAALERTLDERDDGQLYDLELLIYHPDFRRQLAMRYIGQTARRFGVAQEVPPVLSMPLGAVEITLEESVSLYQGIASGESIRFPSVHYVAGEVTGMRRRREGAGVDSPLLLISEVRDRRGNILYRARPEITERDDGDIGNMVVDILTNVVEHGTGVRAHRAFPDVALAGKTGTTNDFRNAAFLGYAPSRRGMVTVGAYVGYDDNRSMSRGNTRLQGASGALPVWIGAVEGMVNGAIVEERSEWGELSQDVTVEPVSPEDGGRLAVSTDNTYSVLYAAYRGVPVRWYSPLGESLSPLDIEALRPYRVGSRSAVKN